MMNRWTWAAGSVVFLGSLLAANGCIIVGGSGGSGASGPSGSNSDSSSGSGYVSSSSTGLPGSCTANTKDDTCTSCEKASCCAELTACTGDATCTKSYGDYSSCLFPDGMNASGYSSAYCKASVGADQNAAGKLIDCLTSKCGTDTSCGTEPQITWTNFAAEFTEVYCSGCHFPGFVAPNGKAVPTDIPQFTDDAMWSYWPNPDPMANPPQGGPKFNPDWFKQMNYAAVKGGMPNLPTVPDQIWCGVSIQLPTECASKFPGAFPVAERFPPAGTDPQKAQCTWAADGMSCPQPTDVERAKMSSWIFGGLPQ